MIPCSVETRTATDTEALARGLGARLGPGAVLLLYGDLGSGKTTFVRGLAAGLGVDPEDVSSPTFTLVQEYSGRLRLQHVDLYRVTSGTEIEELGLDECTARGDVVVIEWADRLKAVPAGAIAVTIEDLGDDCRRLSIRNVAGAHVC